MASAGNGTWAARVAGEHSTTEPPMQILLSSSSYIDRRISLSVCIQLFVLNIGDYHNHVI